MEKSREEFIVFVREAMNDRQSGAHEELYQFLVNNFTRADVHMNGKVGKEQFDTLIEAAAALPRLYGFAPKTSEMYPTESQRKTGRAKLFKDMDTNKDGCITLEEWVTFALDHIAEKVHQRLPKDCLGGSNKDVTKQEFVAFMKKAVNKSSPEYRELYFFLVKTFEKGDKDRCGSVGPKAFDLMIEDAAEAPRRFGLAPTTASMFPNAQARFAKRKEYFDNMDTNRNGTISLDEWIEYAYKHICVKIAGV